MFSVRGDGASCSATWRRSEFKLPRKGPFPRKHLEENDAQRIDVGAVVRFVRFAQGLFRGHVGGCSEDAAFEGDARFGWLSLRQAEVDQVGFCVAVDEDVRRLEVPVNDAGLVGVCKGPGRLGAERGRLAGRDRMNRQPVGQIRPVDQFVDEIGLAVFVTEFQYLHDVRMVEPGRRSSLVEGTLRLRRRKRDRGRRP